jgi:hypothetical protein
MDKQLRGVLFVMDKQLRGVLFVNSSVHFLWTSNYGVYFL